MEFVDLKSQYQNNKAAIDRAIADVLDHGRFIMGPEVSALEDRISAYCGAKHAVTCANGTDALQLALMGEGVGPGDAVFLPSFTFTATAEVVLLLGAVPVFCDVDENYFNIDPNSLQTKIADTRAAGDVRPAAIIAVDLFGMPADYSEILKIASDEEMVVIADAAQSFGASQNNERVGCLAGLRDKNRQAIFVHWRIAIAELGSNINRRGNTRIAFNPIPPHLRGEISRATSDQYDPIDFTEIQFIGRQ